MQVFPNLVANDYKSHVVVNGVVTFWLISISVMQFDATHASLREQEESKGIKSKEEEKDQNDVHELLSLLSRL